MLLEELLDIFLLDLSFLEGALDGGTTSTYWSDRRIEQGRWTEIEREGEGRKEKGKDGRRKERIK